MFVQDHGPRSSSSVLYRFNCRESISRCTVSYCVALKVLKFPPEEARDEAREHVEKVPECRRNVGMANFVDLRSILDM